MKERAGRLIYSRPRMKRLVAIALLSLSLELIAAPAPGSLRLGLSLYGNGTQSLETQSRIAGTELQATYERAFSPSFSARAVASLQMETGSARQRFATDFGPRQVQRLREAKLTWTPSADLGFSLGALDQHAWDSPLLIQRLSFPGISERFERRFGHWSVSVSAQQSVASDTSTAQPFGQWPQGMPAFYLERVALGYENAGSALTLQATHFLFENLSNPSAAQAQFQGNTVTGSGATALYAYGFQGFEWAATVKGRVGRFSPLLRSALLTNAAAPLGKSTGWRLAAEMGWETGELRLTPQVEFFRVESDAAPAFFRDRVFGHGNRAGFGLALGLDIPASGIQCLAQWVRSDVLAANAYQSGMDWVRFQMSVDYDLL